MRRGQPAVYFDDNRYPSVPGECWESCTQRQHRSKAKQMIGNRIHGIVSILMGTGLLCFHWQLTRRFPQPVIDVSKIPNITCIIRR
jgi:hypothetical protein